MPRCGRPARRAVSRPVCANEKNPALSVDRKPLGTSKRASHPARPVPAVAPRDPRCSADACRSAIGRPILWSSTYFEFTITPSSGSFPLESISFGSRSTNTGPLSWTLRSSDDNYATDLVTPGTLVNDSTWAYASAPLTTVFIGSAATTFRIYGYNGTGTPSVNFANWRIDDVQAIVVPEPATLTAAAAAALSIGLWLRRRQRPA